MIVLEGVANKIICNTTHYYLSVEEYNRQCPRRQYKYCYPGLRYPRQQLTVASDNFFPKIKYSRGNTISQFFVANTYDKKGNQKWNSLTGLIQEIRGDNNLRKYNTQNE